MPRALAVLLAFSLALNAFLAWSLLGTWEAPAPAKHRPPPAPGPGPAPEASAADPALLARAEAAVPSRVW